MELLNRFQKNLTDKKFMRNEKPVLLAVSGGIDSMVMANLFLKSKIPFAVAHCNFQLRGSDADMDEALVKEWSEKNSIPFYSVRFETKKKAEEWKKGIQETARILRYEWLDIVCREQNFSKLATAHHANDNVETLLMNLFKGTGIAGLHGIPEQTEKVIRPLLFAGREEIAEYAQQQNIAYREDASNATDNYLRNSVRHQIIPVAEQLFPGAIKHASDSIRRFAEAEALYNKAVSIEKKQLMQLRGKDWYVPVLKLQKRKALETICYELFKPFGFTSSQIPFVIQLLSAESGKYIDSEAYRIIRDRNFLIVTAKIYTEADLIAIEGVPCTINVNGYDFKFSIEKKPATIPSATNIACIDAKNISFPLLLRKWRTGDYFYPLGMGMKKKKLSKFFIDQKLPLHEKEQVWLVECQKKIAWLAGLRPDERFKVKATTEQVLRIEMKKAQH